LGEVKGLLIQTWNQEEGWTNVQCQKQNEEFDECGAINQSGGKSKASNIVDWLLTCPHNFKQYIKC
jgi:hypothetical protein